MKKIISLILTVAMLLSFATFVAPVSAETEVNDLFMGSEREEILNSKRSQPVELYLFQDIFATYDERISADWYSWTSGNISNFWPYKGIGSGIEPKYPLTRSDSSADFAMMIDLGTGASTYTDGMDIKSNPLVSYDTETERYFVKTDGISYKLGEIAEGKKGGNFATFGVNYDVKTNKIADGIGVKEQVLNADVYPNIGTASQITKAIYPVNRTGVTELNFLMTTPMVAATTKERASRVPATIRYADGSEEKIALLVGTVGADLQDAIVAVPKQYTTYTDVQANKVAAKTVTGKDVTNENVTIASTGEKNYLSEKSFVLATFMRSWKGGEFAGYVHSFSIPVDPSKTINSVTFEKDSSAIIGHYSENVPSKTTGTDMSTYVPVTIEGAPTDTYNYYIHVARSCGSSGIFAMSTSYETYQSKIDKIEARIEALDTPYNSAQKIEIAEIMNEIEALKKEGVLESDFEYALITKLDDLYATAEEEIKAAQIASVEGKITNMAFKYISSMREEVEGIKAEYDALIASGILSSEFNPDLMTKFTKVYDVYVMSAGLEDKVNGWGTEYLYEMYADVIASKDLAEGLKKNPSAGEHVVAADTVEKINKFASLADAGSKIDTAIDGLDIIYNKDQLETIVAIKKDIDEFKTAGGTDNGLANAEIFNAIYQAAGADLLQRDIDIVVEKIEALPEFYTATADNDIAEIQTAIAAIEAKGGVIPTDAEEKLSSLIAQRDEAPSYLPFDLPYNKDVTESLTRYQNQFRDANGNYVKDANGHFENQLPSEKRWTFAAFLTGQFALVEEDMVSKLGVDLSTNKATIQGVPYQFGKIKTTVDGVIDAEKNSMTSEISKTLTVDVPNNAYSKLHTAMWADTDNAGMSVKYIYADGSSSSEENVKKIAGYRGTLSNLYSQNPTYYKVLNNDGKASIRYYREYMPQYDSSPGGGYSIAIGDHILTPDDKKILDKIEFVFATSDAHVFAMTGQIANSVLLNKVLEDTVNNIETIEEANVRAALEGCTNIMNTLDEKEVSYDASFAETVATNKDKFVAIESVTTYTDLDNMTYTIKFTGPVAPSSITKALFAVTETIVEGTVTKEEAFTDYEIVPVETDGEIREVKVVIKNDYNYDRKLNLTISSEVAGVSGKTILTKTKKAYDAMPAVDAEITIENAAGTVKLTNNMTGKQEVTAIVAVYDANNSMVAKYLINKVLASGETASQPVAFDLQEGQTIECLILDSLKNSRKIYNTYILE